MERTKRELARVEKWEKDNADGYTKIYTNFDENAWKYKDLREVKPKNLL